MGLISPAIEMPNALVDVVLLVGMDDNTSLVPLEKVSHQDNMSVCFIPPCTPLLYIKTDL